MKKLAILSIFLLIFMLATTYSRSSEGELIDVSLNEPFQLKVDQTARLGDEGLNVKFLEVLEDSLCPPDVQCFWEGAVVIHADVRKGEEESEYLMAFRSGQESYNNIPRKIIVDGYSVEFLGFKEGLASLEISKGNDGQEGGLEGTWMIYKAKRLSSEWHHKDGKIVEKLDYD